MSRAAAWPQRALIALVRLYRLLFSAWLGGQCRFVPSCSAYAIEALQRHGAVRGVWLTTGRLLRCHPWCAGGCDPVPQGTPALFRHLVKGPHDEAGRTSSRETTSP